MNAAIQQRVDQFVQEILGLVEQVSTERRAAALSAVATVLANAGRPPKAGASATRRLPASATGRASRKAAAPQRRGKVRPRGPRATTAEAASPAAIAPSNSSDAPKGTAGPASSSSGVADAMGEASETVAPTTAPAAPASAPAGLVPEREAQVLGAVRALGQATALEVAERTGLPNGSVVVALRALVARGHVARAKTDRGVEYSSPDTTAVA